MTTTLASDETQADLDTRVRSAQAILVDAVARHGHRLTLAAGLGVEGQVLIDLAHCGRLAIAVFTIDTGRLFPEAYDLIEQTEVTYGIRIAIYCPSNLEVEALVARLGVNGFRSSPVDRHECCRIRKRMPLERALANRSAWVCGLRRCQSPSRAAVQATQFDEIHGIEKICPLWDWSGQEVWDYVKRHDVPYNPLHDRQFPSIGCACCTRAILPGTDPRSGRWWWEQDSHRECGLHRRPPPSGEGI